MKRTPTFLMLLAAALLPARAHAEDLLPPDAPYSFGVVAPAGHTSLTLRWVAPFEDTEVAKEDPVVDASSDGGPSVLPLLEGPPPEGACVAYDLRYSTSPINATTWATATQVAGEPAPAAPGTWQQMTLTGLQPSRTYYFAIRAIDDGGNVSPLATLAAPTAADTVAPAAVANFRITTLQAASATFAWNAPADDDGSTVSAYDLRWSSQPISPVSWNSATPLSGEPSPGLPTTAETLTLPAPGTGTCYFAMVAIDTAGNPGPLSSVEMASFGSDEETAGETEGRSSPCSSSSRGVAAAWLALLLLASRRRC